MKRSTSYHGLGNIARALLTELIDRYNGCNNGMIVLGVREAAYELGCSKSTISEAFRELDDAGLRETDQGRGLARPSCDRVASHVEAMRQDRRPAAQLGRSGSHTSSCSCPHRRRCRSPMPNGPDDTATARPTVTKTVTMSSPRGTQKFG